MIAEMFSAMTFRTQHACFNGAAIKSEFMLQWGRDQMIAEIGRRVKDGLYPGRLQWGRDQMIAEIATYLRTDHAHIGLQWGRDQMIAEMDFRGNRAVVGRGFNGAAIK